MHYHCLACFGASIVETGLSLANGQPVPAAIGQAIAVLDYCRPAITSREPYLDAMKCAFYGNAPKTVRDDIERCRSYQDAYLVTRKILEDFESGAVDESIAACCSRAGSYANGGIQLSARYA